MQNMNYIIFKNGKPKILGFGETLDEAISDTYYTIENMSLKEIQYEISEFGIPGINGYLNYCSKDTQPEKFKELIKNHRIHSVLSIAKQAWHNTMYNSETDKLTGISFLVHATPEIKKIVESWEDEDEWYQLYDCPAYGSMFWIYHIEEVNQYRDLYPNIKVYRNASEAWKERM